MRKITETDIHKHLDLEELLIVMTVGGRSDSLATQFMNTITLAEIAIKKAEIKHPKLITAGWGSFGYVTTDNTMDRRAIYILDYKQQKEALLPFLYFNLLAEIRHLRDIAKLAAKLTEEPAIVFDLKRFMDTRLSPPAWPSVEMLNKITPCIFSMFMLSTRLIGNIDNRAAVTDLITIERRTKMGGHASNAGTEVLVDFFSEAIKNIPNNKKWKSLNGFVNDNINILTTKLSEFQNNRFYSDQNMPVTAGSKLKAEGLYNAFRRWSKKDKKFLAAIVEKVPSIIKNATAKQ